MSDSQMKAAMKMLRNVCQPKYKATDAQIEAMHKGDWNQDRAGQCYNWCIINMNKLLDKDNNFLWEHGVKILEDQAPDSFREAGIACTIQCKDAVKTPSDKCAAGFEIAKCVYECNPEKFFFP